ncbi:hypothetical protein LTR84_010098 [Exophiala bonariae]|uniref:HNH nuclease domain-containing protein n=1 Tax=Exophiala bonariae TaxID=1690606 RepID=A0AAV9NKN0_9EURO|nr:hypothetical protein LTR84_010098 [Exophiala bonariae]
MSRNRRDLSGLLGSHSTNLSHMKVTMEMYQERAYHKNPKNTINGFNPTGTDKGVKTLLQLGAEKAIEAFHGLGDYNTVLNFVRRIESMQKDFLFLTLLADHHRLLISEQKYTTLLKYCPPADQDLYNSERRNLAYHHEICFELDRQAGGDFVDGNHRPPNTEYFSQIWAYDPNASTMAKKDDSFIEWTTRDLVSPAPQERRLELGSYGTYFETRTGSIAVRHGPSLVMGHTSLFSQFISSQLLLYRLTCLFGQPPSNEVSEGGLWDATLVYKRRSIFLTFGEDLSGEPYIRFYGSEEASVEALKLINHLVSNLITNEFARSLCGGNSQNSRWMVEMLSDHPRS